MSVLALTLAACGGGGGVGSSGTPNDTTPPTLQKNADNETDALTLENKTLTVTFSEPVKRVEGLSDEDFKSKFTVTKFEGNESAKLTVARAKISSNATSVVITVKEFLKAEANYQVETADGALTDASGNPFRGGDTETHTPSTADTTPPELASDVLSVSKDKKVLTITFDEAITDKVDDSITVRNDVTAVPGGTIGIDGNTITITYDSALAGGDYTVEFAAGAVASAGGSTTQSLTTESATIDTTPPTLKKGSSGAVDALEIDPANNTLTITFSEQIQRAKGDSGDPITDEEFRNKFQVYYVDSSRPVNVGIPESATISEDGLSVALIMGNDLSVDTLYYVRISGGVLTDLAGNALNSDADFTGTNRKKIAPTPPTLKKDSSGATDALEIDLDANTFTVTFSEPVVRVEGLSDEDFKSKIKLDGVTVSSVTLRNATTLFMRVDRGFSIADGDYKVEISDGALTDESGNALAATTTETDTIDTTAPNLANDSLEIDPDANTFTVTFNEEIRKANGLSDADFVPKFVIYKTPHKGGDIYLYFDLPTSAAILSNDLSSVQLTVNNLTDGNYRVDIRGEALMDSLGNTLAESVITTSATVDTVAPVLKQDANDVEKNDALEIDPYTRVMTITFSEAVSRVKGLSYDAFQSAFTVTGLNVREVKISDDGLNVMIKTTEPIVDGEDYAVNIGENVLADLAGNLFAGGTTETEEADVAPTLAENALRITSNPDADTYIFTVLFSETIQRAKDDNGDPITDEVFRNKFHVYSAHPESIFYRDAVESATISEDGLSVVLIVSNDITADTAYLVAIRDGALTDLTGNRAVQRLSQDTIYTNNARVDTTAASLDGGEEYLGINGVVSDADYGF